MLATETAWKPFSLRADPPPFVFFQDIDVPGVVQGREPSLVNSYDIRIVAREAVATTAFYVIPGTITVPIAHESPTWRTWLPEVDARVFGTGLRSRSAIGRQVEEIQSITSLSDTQLAAAFPSGLSRETVNRWRNRPNPNLREENIYRLGLLHELARRMEEAGIDARVWLHQAGEDGETPYALICQGRLGDVRRAVELVATGAVSPVERMAAVRAYREHDAVVEEDDERDWTWGEADGETEE